MEVINLSEELQRAQREFKLRRITNVYRFREHSIHSNDKTHLIRCSGYGCRLCELNNGPYYQGMFAAIDRLDNVVRIFKCDTAIRDCLLHLEGDCDYLNVDVVPRSTAIDGTSVAMCQQTPMTQEEHHMSATFDRNILRRLASYSLSSCTKKIARRLKLEARQIDYSKYISWRNEDIDYAGRRGGRL
jgi:hypothetical protein